MPIEGGEVFQRIYRNSEWGRGSGPGSSPSNTIEYRAFIESFIQANAIKQVTDFGCGDWQFSHLIDWTGIDYLGIDFVSEVVDENNKRFSSTNIEFRQVNDIDEIPTGDLLIAKEVLQHLPNSVVREFLIAIRKKYRFALLTNTTAPRPMANQDIPIGGFRPLRLQDTPFDAPCAVVFTYFAMTNTYIYYKNTVFLMFGTISHAHR
jgi:SAM-dependent methyltransferase